MTVPFLKHWGSNVYVGTTIAWGVTTDDGTTTIGSFGTIGDTTRGFLDTEPITLVPKPEKPEPTREELLKEAKRNKRAESVLRKLGEEKRPDTTKNNGE